jgi:hypothetical protein
VFWFSLQILSETFLILRRNERDISCMYIGLHVKYPLLLLDFNETWIFSIDFRKILKHQTSWISVQCSRVVPWGRTDSQTEVTNLIVAYAILRTRLNRAHWCYISNGKLCINLSTPRARTVLRTQAQQITTSSTFSNVFYVTLNVHYRIHNSSSQNYTLKPVNMLFL